MKRFFSFNNKATLVNEPTEKVMKWKLAFSIGILLFSCSKSNDDLGPDYPLLVGNWGALVGDDAVQIEFKKNGRIKLSSSVQRGKSIKAFTFETFTSKQQLSTSWHTVTYSQNDKSISVDVNSTYDTISIETGSFIEDFVLVSSNKKAYLFRIE